MLKHLRLVAVASGAAILLAACSSPAATPKPSSTASGPVTITLESYMPSFGANGVAELKSLVSGFEEANPTITLKVVSDMSGASSDLASAYQREAATSSLPDVGQIAFDSLRFAIKSLGAQSLDKTYGTKAVSDLFGGSHPYAVPVTKLAVVDGHTYGIPWTLSTPVLFYNPTLFEKAGLDPAKPPTTWDEVGKDAAAIKSATGAGGISVGCVGQGAKGYDWCLQGIFGSRGGSVLDKNGSSTTFDSKENIAAISTLRSLAEDGVIEDLADAQMVQEFSTGKLAMAITTSARQSTLLTAIGPSFDLKNGPMPGFSGHKVTPTNSGSALMVFSKDPAKQQAAWKLVQFLTSPQSQTTITENVGYPPLRTSLADDASFLKPFATKHPLLAVNLAQLDHLTPWQSYPGPNFLQVETLIVDAASKAIFQGEDPATALKAAQSQAAGLVQ